MTKTDTKVVPRPVSMKPVCVTGTTSGLSSRPKEMNCLYGDPKYVSTQKQLTAEMYGLQNEFGDSPVS